MKELEQVKKQLIDWKWRMVKNISIIIADEVDTETKSIKNTKKGII